MKVIRRHRLLERFLAETLTMSWDEVHEEAEHMEHAASERLIDRIDAYLGYPAVDPHGDPIPRADGSLAETEGVPLARCQAGQQFRVVRVMDQDPAFLRYLSECGLELHAAGELLENRPEAGALVCKLGGHVPSRWDWPPRGRCWSTSTFRQILHRLRPRRRAEIERLGHRGGSGSFRPRPLGRSGTDDGEPPASRTDAGPPCLFRKAIESAPFGHKGQGEPVPGDSLDGYGSITDLSQEPPRWRFMVVTTVHPRHGRRTDRQQCSVGAQIGAGRWLGKSSQPPDGLRLRRPCEGRWRLNRDRKQLGFATIKVFGHQNCPRTVVNQAFRVKPILARQAIKRHRPCRNRLVSLDVWVGLIDTVNHAQGQYSGVIADVAQIEMPLVIDGDVFPVDVGNFQAELTDDPAVAANREEQGGIARVVVYPDRYQRAAGS